MKILIKHISFALTGITPCLPLVAAHADVSRVGWSLTLETGGTQGADRSQNFRDVLASRPYIASLDSYDNTAHGYSVNLEARTHKNLAFEFAYRDLGKTSAHFDACTLNGQFGRDVVDNQGLLGRGITLGAKFYIPVSDEMEIWTQLGAFLWQDSAVFHNEHRAGLANANYRRSNLGIDPFWGLGMVYELNEVLDASVAYRQFKVDRQTVKHLSLGLGFKFGQAIY